MASTMQRSPVRCQRQCRASPRSRLTAAMIIARASGSVSVKEMSSQMKDMQARMQEDEQLKVLMAGLRGTNMDDSDFAGSSVKMNLVEVQRGADDTDSLPLVWDPEAIQDYWSRRPVSVITRIMQLTSTAGGFVSRLVWDAVRGKLKENEVARAVELRNIMTSLGPAYIKLGQALSIRPDLLSPAAMNELQKLCDKVPSYPTNIAMKVLQDELGAPWQEIYAELTPEPIAAASLGQVYKGKLKTGEMVAVKVQRPGVLETVTIDLYILRAIGVMLRDMAPEFTKRADVVALLDEWASRFFEELDYNKEGQNALKFAEQMKVDLPQVVVPMTYTEYTSRRVLTTEWLEGEKLSQSKADDVGDLVNIGVICYLKQLLDTGFFHADPHPGNLIRTPDGRLAVLDFGLVTQVDDDVKYGMIEAISHLIHRDYEAIVQDFVTLDFIPKGTDLRPILPVLAKVFDKALEGGGAKNINFQELAADLAEITFHYPFRIPPHFALMIRAIGVLEGIALVGNPDFALVDEAYPYISRRLLTDPSPRLREALRYMVYGKSNVFDADRVIDLLVALENFQIASTSAMGDTANQPRVNQLPATTSSSPFTTNNSQQQHTLDSTGTSSFPQLLPIPLPGFGGVPFPGGAVGLSIFESSPVGQLLGNGTAGLLQGPGMPAAMFGLQPVAMSGNNSQTREALRFMLSPEGTWFRSFVMDELVKSVDALSRDQLHVLARNLGLASLRMPVLLPGASRSSIALAPPVNDEDRQVVENLNKILNFLTRGQLERRQGLGDVLAPSVLNELLPVLPTVAREVLPELSQRLASRVAARLVRDLYA